LPINAERPVVELVRRIRTVGRLHRGELLGEVRVERDEVDRLAGRVDLRLMPRFRLAENRGRVDAIALDALQER
jgi:hypothetical protein